MCGRYNITKSIEAIEQELSLDSIRRELFDDKVNIAPGDLAPVLTWQQPRIPELMLFGFTPFWSKKKMYVFNARAEGDANKENNRDYRGNPGILKKPMFRHAIRHKRCLVIATSYIEGPLKEKLSRPYLVFKSDFAPFTFGGIWDEWINQETGELLRSFAIITTAANHITHQIGHHRAPLIITPEHRQKWLNPDTNLSEVVELLKPNLANDFNAYPISSNIKNPKLKNPEALLPIAPPILKQYEWKEKETIELLGMKPR